VLNLNLPDSALTNPRKGPNAMESERLKKVQSLLEQELSGVIQRIAKDHFRGILYSVTRVKLSPDLSLARAYISIFPVTDKKAALEALDEHHSEIKLKLGQSLRHQLRIMPELRLILDDSLDYEENIDRLLRGDGENPLKPRPKPQGPGKSGDSAP